MYTYACSAIRTKGRKETFRRIMKSLCKRKETWADAKKKKKGVTEIEINLITEKFDTGTSPQRNQFYCTVQSTSSLTCRM